MPHLNQRGSLLIGLIIAMTIIAVLGAGAVYLTSTSALGEVLENNQARAHYLAESGQRYGVGVKKIGGSSPEKVPYTYSMDGGKSKFVLYVYTTFSDSSTSYARFYSEGIVNEGTWAEGRKRLTFEVYSSGAGTSTTTRRCMCRCQM